MSKKLLVILVSLLMLASLTAGVAADASITISGGQLSLIPQEILLPTIILNGADQLSEHGGSVLPWVAKDPTGLGAGWKGVIKTSTFTSGSHTIPTLDGPFKMLLTDANITVVEGNTKPTSAMSMATALTDTEQIFVAAALEEGMGTYEIVPEFSLEVPAETYAGLYSAQITTNITAGP